MNKENFKKEDNLIRIKDSSDRSGNGIYIWDLGNGQLEIRAVYDGGFDLFSNVIQISKEEFIDLLGDE